MATKTQYYYYGRQLSIIIKVFSALYIVLVRSRVWLQLERFKTLIFCTCPILYIPFTLQVRVTSHQHLFDKSPFLDVFMTIFMSKCSLRFYLHYILSQHILTIRFWKHSIVLNKKRFISSLKQIWEITYTEHNLDVNI